MTISCKTWQTSLAAEFHLGILDQLSDHLSPPNYFDAFIFAQDVPFAYTKKDDTKQTITS